MLIHSLIACHCKLFQFFSFNCKELCYEQSHTCLFVHMCESSSRLSHLSVEFLNYIYCTFLFYLETLKRLSKLALRKLTSISRPQELHLGNMGNNDYFTRLS